MSDRRLLLVDASPYVFRSYFALPDSIRDPRGRPVHAVQGFGAFLAKLLRERPPSHLAVAFDESLTTSFRNEIYPGYKSGREKPPAELKAQIADCREMAGAWGATVLAHERYEADDLIAATLAECRLGAGDRAWVVSGDKDLAQLVGPRVSWLDAATGREWDERGVMDKMGVLPGQVPDLLGLAGDPVDAIPGVPGVGPKSARAILSRYPSLEEALADLEGVAALPVRGARGLARKLGEHAETALLSKRLATVARDAPGRPGWREVRWRGRDEGRLAALCERLGFVTLAERWLGDEP